MVHRGIGKVFRVCELVDVLEHKIRVEIRCDFTSRCVE